jgi:hypothetical protein
MDSIEIKPSRAKFALLFLAACAFVAAGIAMIVYGPASDTWIGWVCTFFFGGGLLIFGRQLFDARPRLVINRDGVFDRTLGVGVIAWSEIRGASLRSIKGNDFIALELYHPEVWIGRLSRMQQALVTANRELGFGVLNLNLVGLQESSQSIYELILKHLERQEFAAEFERGN